ncbi:hypothetical protein LVJ94_31935 [Pendulispora rubella]|uniref:Lipoprotein n=1 Tax=Pendulispora rubella TaxID=2741070 RepID=A0ABZ2KSM0_9BACT
MNWTRGVFALGGVAAVFVVVACSSSSSSEEETGAEQGPVTSVDKDKQLNQLSDQEAETYCLDTNKWARKYFTAEVNKGSNCNEQGIYQGQQESTVEAGRTKCSEVRKACIAKAPPDAGAIDAGIDPDEAARKVCKVFKTRISKCNSLTISNSNGCWGEFLKYSRQFSAKDACTDMTLDTPGDDPVGDMVSSVCDPWKACVLSDK